MARYLVERVSFIGDVLVAPGSVIEYLAPPGTVIGSNLTLVSDDTPLASRPPNATEIGESGNEVDQF